MKSDIKVGNWDSSIRWMAGAAILGFGVYEVYQWLKTTTDREDLDLQPALSAAEPHPYFDPHPHRPQAARIPKNPLSGHRTHMGNGPGERNQIGSRTSGKKAR